MLADKAASDRLQAARTEQRAQKREQDLLRIARGAVVPNSTSASTRPVLHAHVGDEAAASEDDGDLNSDEDDDEFMRSYREARLKGDIGLIICLVCPVIL